MLNRAALVLGAAPPTRGCARVRSGEYLRLVNSKRASSSRLIWASRQTEQHKGPPSSGRRPPKSMAPSLQSRSSLNYSSNSSAASLKGHHAYATSEAIIFSAI